MKYLVAGACVYGYQRPPTHLSRYERRKTPRPQRTLPSPADVEVRLAGETRPVELMTQRAVSP